MIDRVLLELLDRVTEIERKVERITRWGTVASVDMDAGTVRVSLRGHADPTPAVRWAALSTAVWAPPTVGEQCLLIAPGGTDKVGAMVAICGIGTGSGPGDKYRIGPGATMKVALADLVESELQAIATALTGVSSGGGALTGANTYTAPGSVAASKTEAE